MSLRQKPGKYLPNYNYHKIGYYKGNNKRLLP